MKLSAQTSPPIGGFFLRVVSFATGMGFAGMLGSLACLSRGPTGKLVISWSPWVLPWAALGFAAGLYFWRLLWRAEAEENPQAPARRQLVRYAILLGIGSFVSFVYPIRFVDPIRRREVLLGLGMAIVVLGFVGWLVFVTIRWVSANELKDGESEPADSPPAPDRGLKERSR